MNLSGNLNLDNEQAALAGSIWHNALKIIQPQLAKMLFVTWVEPLVPFYVDENYLYLAVQDNFSYRYLLKYVNLFEEALAASNSFKLQVKLFVGNEGMQQALAAIKAAMSNNSTDNQSQVSDQGQSNIPLDSNNIAPKDTPKAAINNTTETSAAESAGGYLTSEQTAKTTTTTSTTAPTQTTASANQTTNNSPLAAEIVVNPLYQQHFRRDYRFDNFIVGPNNTMAHAACLAIANSYFNPGQKPYNPLFLYGGSGLGKTHLLNAVGNMVMQHRPNTKILYLQTEEFVNEFIATIRKQNYNVFRNKYRNCDLLLIDDIQFIEGKEQMQEEFFYTFNALYENNSYIIITCDKHPRYLVTLEDRLKTRFLSGLACDINPPTYETRMAILQARAQSLQENIDPDIISYIAKNISLNIRELEGALNSVLAIKHLSGYINLALAQKALEPVIKRNMEKTVSPDFIADVVANYYNVSKAQLYSRCKESKFTYPRHIAMYFCRELLDMTYADISQAFNRSDHTTTRNACLKIAKSLSSDLQLQKELANIQKSLHEQ